MNDRDSEIKLKEDCQEVAKVESTHGKSFWQFIKFSIVGLSNTIISQAVYTILVYFKMHYAPASFLGFFVSVINAYYWNQKFVFKKPEGGLMGHLKTFSRTFTVYLGTYFLSLFLLFIWIDVIHISNWMTPLADLCHRIGFESFNEKFLGDTIAAILNIFVTVPINFVMNKFWAFKEKRKVTAQTPEKQETDR
ncbi:MAG: GtrA family protein [Lachnospiraceae bacterium]|nr:GtrA family protein [Lachnospiraceae bacterium]